MGKTVFLNKWCWENWTTVTSHTKINSKWI